MSQQVRGAKHLVRSLDGNLELWWDRQERHGVALPAPTPENIAKHWYERKSDGPKIFMMEHCYLGALFPWIAKAANNNVKFPDRLLWRLMYCRTFDYPLPLLPESRSVC